MSLSEKELNYYFGENRIPQRLGEYDANKNLIYLGYAPAGSAEADAHWIILKNTYDGDGDWTATKRAINVTWSGRAAHTYV